jgi:replicative DNA helicase
VNNAAYQRVAEFLKPEHFADPLHGKLFDSLTRLIERGQVVSAITLKTYVEQDEAMKEAGGAAYLARLAAASVHVIDAGAFGRTVHDLYLRRQLIDLGESVVNGAFSATSRKRLCSRSKSPKRNSTTSRRVARPKAASSPSGWR